MDEMSRRKFMRFGIGSTIVATFAVASAYFLMRGPEWGFPKARLPPGQSEVDVLQLSSVGPVPEIDLDKWNLELCGEVEKCLKLDWAHFLQLPTTVHVSGLHCVAGWSKLENSWEGVAFREIMSLAHPTVNAKYATIECYGDVGSGNEIYATQIPLDDLLHDDVLFAYRLDGNGLSPEHGGPVRLIIPSKYGYKSAKWVKSVRFTDKQKLGYYERRGYSNTADPWTEDRFA